MFSNPKRASIVLQAGFLFLLGAFSLHGNCAPAKRAAPAGIDSGTSEIPPPATHSVLGSSGSDTVSRAVTVAASSDIIPADRLYDWGAYCGVPGGIPARTRVYASFSPGATAASINAAINARPSGQVVYLSTGTYNGNGLVTDVPAQARWAAYQSLGKLDDLFR